MIQERLAAIQRELKAPKGRFNAFGKYKYRSCEDILDAVKPLLLPAVQDYQSYAADGSEQKGVRVHPVILTLTDDMVMVGDRHYIKATATLHCQGETVSVTAWAREEADKKGMDAAQITGSVSSYARKYALNGLFLIDDAADADTMDNTKETKKAAPVPPPKPSPAPPVSTDAEKPPEGEKLATPGQVKQIQIIMKSRGFTERQAILDDLTGFCGRLIKSSKEITFDEAHEFIEANIGKDAA